MSPLRVDAMPTLALILGVGLRDFWGQFTKQRRKIAQKR
jgi:hypothetical protein